MRDRFTTYKNGWCVLGDEAYMDDALAIRGEAIDLLADYEDTGLTPEMCAEYKKFEDEAVSKNVTFARIVELMNAEYDGRLFVLPCKVGKTVYRVVRHRVDVSGYRMEWEWETMVEAVPFRVGMVEAIGKTIFPTRKEAEAALKEANNGE